MPEKEVIKVGEQGVADYLRRNPSFFEDKPTLLADLRVPHSTGSAVSLVERQVAVLRDGKDNLQDQLNNLIQIARVNDQLNTQLHQFTLKLIESHGLGDLLTSLVKDLRQNFSADLVAVHLTALPRDANDASYKEFVADADAFCGSFQRLLSAGKPYCGRLKTEQLQTLFSEDVETIGSTVFLPLGKAGSMGVLAIASFDPQRFTADADTAFLSRMAEVVTAVFRQYLNDVVSC